MTKKQAGSFRSMGRWLRIVLIAASMVCQPTGSFALEGDATPSERAACTPDVFRLCGSEIPNVHRIIACMVAKRARLSPPCKSVFAKRAHELKAAQNSQ